MDPEQLASKSADMDLKCLKKINQFYSVDIAYILILHENWILTENRMLLKLVLGA